MKAKHEFNSSEEYREYLQTYFAVLAMQGLLANSAWMNDYKGEKYLMQKDIIASISVKLSDELLTQLETSKSDKV